MEPMDVVEEYAGVDQLQTGYSVEEFRFIWKIENFDAALQQIPSSGNDGIIDDLNEIMEKAKTIVETGHKIGCVPKWEFYTQLQFICGCRKPWVVLIASNKRNRNLTPAEKTKSVLASIEVEKSEGCPVDRKHTSNTFTVGSIETMELQLFQSGDSDALDILKANNGCIKLYLKLKLMITWNRKEEKLETLVEIEKQLFLKRIANLQSENNEGAGYDVTLQVGQAGSKIGAHRVILAARSPVFARMFQSQMSEALTGNVHIRDLSKKALEVIIHFIYHGDLKRGWGDVVDELAYGAEKYELTGLSGLVSQKMVGLCNEDNAEELLEIAKTYQSLGNAKTDIENFLNR